MRHMRRPAVLAASAGLVLWSATASGPAIAQLRPDKAPDPIDQSRGLSTKPVPSAPSPEQPTERVVPESRHRDPATGREIVVPPRYERSGPGLPSTSPSTLPSPGTLPPASDSLPRPRGR
jgi:hypothetical protein